MSEFNKVKQSEINLKQIIQEKEYNFKILPDLDNFLKTGDFFVNEKDLLISILNYKILEKRLENMEQKTKKDQDKIISKAIALLEVCMKAKTETKEIVLIHQQGNQTLINNF